MNEYEERLERVKQGIRNRMTGARRRKSMESRDEFWDGFICACEVILSDDIQ